MRRALLTLTALATLTGHARADHQQGNLRALTPADLCPPVSYVYLDDQEQEAVAAKVDEELLRASTASGVTFGDPKTCTVAQVFVVDAFRTRDGRVLYSLDLSLELLKDAQVGLGTRTLTASHLQLWSLSGYGSLTDPATLTAMATASVSDYYADLVTAWKATHPR